MKDPASSHEETKPNQAFEYLIPIKNRGVVILKRKINDDDLEFGVINTILCYQLVRKPICKN